MFTKKIVIITHDDFANSANFAGDAIRSLCAECRVISVCKHPYQYPQDVVVKEDGVQRANEIIEDADIIHFWNNAPLYPGLHVPDDKMRSWTFTGSWYRQEHTEINKKLRAKNIAVTVQNPSYRYWTEIDSVFIPHAVPIDLIKCYEADDIITKSIGTYYQNKSNKTTAYADVQELKKMLAEHHPDWSVYFEDQKMPWPERIKQLSRMAYYFEYTDKNMGWFGRSALEATTLGIPVFSYYSNRSLVLTGNYFDDFPIPIIRCENVSDVAQYLRDDVDVVPVPVLTAWIKKFFSYDKVGLRYLEFFESL